MVRNRWLGTLALGLVLITAMGRPAPGQTPAQRKADDIARWNDRSTPRRTLETLYFSILCYDLSPELIVNAIDCLDLSEFGPTLPERDAALMAHELNGILNRRDVALYGVPDLAIAAKNLTIAEEDGIKIVLERQPDGRWRFDRDTIRSIPKMRGLSYARQRETQEVRLKLASGRTDPETTMRTFLGDIVRRDFTAAAKCLDLNDIPQKLRASRGPECARKLAFVMQRCAFVFPQEFPSDPDGWRFIWHSNHRGRIMLDRVRMSDGKDAWLFSKNTLQNLDALVEGFRNVPPDARYARVGVVIEANALTDFRASTVPPPPGVPHALGSARDTMRTFLDAMDALEFDDSQSQALLSCIDLKGIPEAERGPLGLRLAGKLDALLRHYNTDLLCLSDSWEGEPQTIGPDPNHQLILQRQPDGAWRFSQESVASIPELFDQLTVQEKGDRDRRSPFSSARQTVRTLISAVDRGDLSTAAECLNLEQIPAGARDDLGPVIATKIRYVLKHLGNVVVQEVPNENDGPRYYCYRGPSGRMSLAQKTVASRPNDWLFTAETIDKIDSMFVAALERDKASEAPKPTLALVPGLWLRSRMPLWTRGQVLALELYQWCGLLGLAVLSAVIGWGSLRMVALLTPTVLHRSKLSITPDFVAEKLRPVGFLIALCSLLRMMMWLDLPLCVIGGIAPTLKFLWVVVIAWLMTRMIDLAMAVYTNSEHLSTSRNLSDMIVPTAARCCKLLVVVFAVSYEVYLVGNGESLTQLLAGLGLAGLAASLAAQDTIKSVFGTLLLIAERPFKIGDVIIVSGIEGTVESVGFRSTRLRTFEDSVATVPNSLIAGASIDNRGLRNHRRYKETISLAYDTPLERLMRLRDDVRDWALAHPRAQREKVDIFLHRLGDSCVELLVSVYFRTSTYTDEETCRDELNQAILALAQANDVAIAFPTQTIQIAHAPAPQASHAIPKPKFLDANPERSAQTITQKWIRRDEPHGED